MNACLTTHRLSNEMFRSGQKVYAEDGSSETLYILLNLHPSYERHHFNNDAVRRAIRNKPAAAKKMYEFKVGGNIWNVHPIFMAVALGASRDVIELMYNAFPAAVKVKTVAGWTLLHFACCYGAPAETVQLLLVLYPEALSEKDRDWYLPLHYACYLGASWKVLKLMVERYPEALQEKDKNGKTPLMIAKEYYAPPEVVAVLTNERQDCLAGPTLHKLLDLDPSYEQNIFDEAAVRKVIESNPEVARGKYSFKIWGGDHNVHPIFMIVALGASRDLIELIYDAHPVAFMEKTDSGRTPLHYACYYGASPDVIELLVEKYPEALKEKDKDGRLPLHYACYTEAPVETLRLMVKNHPNSISVKDKNGNAPFVIAKQFELSPEVLNLLTDNCPELVPDQELQRLLDLNPFCERDLFENDKVREVIQSNPDAAKSKYNFKIWGGKYSAYPIFMTVSLGASRDVIELVHEACPEAINEKTNSGRTPLHYACYHVATEDVLEFLVEKCPQALGEMDETGNTPLKIAEKMFASAEVLEMLSPPTLYTLLDLDPSHEWSRFDNDAVRKAILCNPDAAKSKYEFKMWGDCDVYPLFMAIAIGASRDVVELIYNACPQVIMEKTDSGRTPLHYACCHKAPAELVELLLDKYPKALFERDRKGRTPLSVAKEYHAPEEVLSLLTRDPSAFSEGRPSPVLHSLLDLNPSYERHKYDDDAVRNVIERNPDAARAKYDFKVWGGVCRVHPIFKAVALGASRDVIELMYNACPEAIMEKTESELTLLHYTCYYRPAIDVVKFLVQLCPDALDEMDKNGDTPHTIACRVRAPADVVDML